MSFERIEPGTREWDAFYANHIQRYRFAARTLSVNPPRNILDAACGVGYGSRYLASELDADVVAVDRDPHALGIAEKEFSFGRVRYLRDDCETLRAASSHAPFDAVVSFETMEHLEHPHDFLRAIGNCLSSCGVAIVSVPNGDVSAGHDWEFHKHDFDAETFVQAFADAGFQRRVLFAQRLTPLGRLREQVRAEIQRIRSNPFVRLGTWLQTRVRLHPSPALPLPEQDGDFEIVPATVSDVRAMGRTGPFVLIAVVSDHVSS